MFIFLVYLYAVSGLVIYVFKYLTGKRGAGPPPGTGRGLIISLRNSFQSIAIPMRAGSPP